MTRREAIIAAAAAGMAAGVGRATSEAFSPVVELRQYTLFGGKRDTLIDLFDTTFVETQEATGIKVIGQFRDLDDPDRFVWLRGFPSMEAREKSLNDFYFGPVWKQHRDAANATLADSDNVLLLQPVAGQGFALPPGRDGLKSGKLIAAFIHYVGGVDPAAFASIFDAEVRPRLAACGADLIGVMQSNPAENNFPRLPVRQGEQVFIWFGRFGDEGQHAAFVQQWKAISGWRDKVPEAVLPAFMRKPETLRLMPTGRSLLR